MSRTPVLDALPDHLKVDDPAYPSFPKVVVGLAPNKLKQFEHADMVTLCLAFQMATGIDPLTASKPLKVIWAEVFREIA